MAFDTRHVVNSPGRTVSRRPRPPAAERADELASGLLGALAPEEPQDPRTRDEPFSAGPAGMEAASGTPTAPEAGTPPPWTLTAETPTGTPTETSTDADAQSAPGPRELSEEEDVDGEGDGDEDGDEEVPLDRLLERRTAIWQREDETEPDLPTQLDVDGAPALIATRQPGEFACSVCFLLKRSELLAHPEHAICRDCAV